MLADILIILIVASVFGICLYKVIKSHKSGGCSGCGGNCSGCTSSSCSGHNAK